MPTTNFVDGTTITADWLNEVDAIVFDVFNGVSTVAGATARLNAFVGDSGAGGTKGLVPAPAAGDAAANKYLKSDGTWATAGVVGPGSSTDDSLVMWDGTSGNLVKDGAVLGTTVAGIATANSFTDTQSFLDNKFEIKDSADATKKLAFELSSIGTGATRTVTIPNKSGIMMMEGAATSSGLTMATSRLLGRTTASTGAIEEISVDSTLTLSGGSLGVTPTSTVSADLGTAVATTSGTTVDFTSIPTGTISIIISGNGVSTSSVSGTTLTLQIGDSGGLETSAYTGTTYDNALGATGWSTNAAIGIQGAVASYVLHFKVILSLVNAATFTWNIAVTCTENTTYYVGNGYKSLSAELTQLRITSTSTLDAGQVNIQYITGN